MRRDRTVTEAEERMQRAAEDRADREFLARWERSRWVRAADAFVQFVERRWVSILLIGGGLMLIWLGGCATVPAQNGGPVYVIKGHDGACKYLAALLNADSIAWTAGKPIACGEEAAKDECLIAHEQVHEKEQAQHERGPGGWLFDWGHEYVSCLKKGRTAADCHEHHSMEQDAIIVQGVCEAERAARLAAEHGGAR